MQNGNLFTLCMQKAKKRARLIKSDGHNDNDDTASHCQGQALQNDGDGAVLK